MDTYIGTKILRAREMRRGEYNNLRGWEIPADENIDTFKAANIEFTYKGGRFTGVVHRIIARPPRPELWVQIDDEIGMVRLCFPFSQYGLTI